MKLTHTYDHYYLYGEITEIMRDFAEKTPGFTRITCIGKTGEGRDILLMEITDLSTGDFSDKPALYVEGNIHAGEVTGSMVVMRFMDTLLSNLDDENIRKLLKDHTVYLLPRVSPDGSEYYLTTPYTLRSVNRPYPFADEMPGLTPKDMDGDRVVRTMRVKTPYGNWKQSPLDPRLMVKRLPDDTEGTFYAVYPEGEIVDFDGLHVKDAPAKYGLDMNRNYPKEWKPEAEQRGAGETPLANPETRANAAFLMAHRNIAAVVDMHTHGGMILYTPGYKSGKQADPHDIRIYKELGEMAHEESGYPVLQVYDEFSPQDDPATFGGFDDFCHFILGIPAHTIECWDIEERSGSPRQFPPKPKTEKERMEAEYKLLKWVDENVPAEDGFQPWTPFTHPQLGEVEIGGMCTKFIQQNPPKHLLDQECEKLTRFLLREVKTLPMITFESVKAEKLGENLYQVQAVIGNRGYLSSYVFKEGLKIPQVKELTAVLSGASAFVEGKEKTGIGHLEGFSGLTASGYGLPGRTIESAPLEKKLSWVVRAEAGTTLTLEVSGGHTGRTSTTVTL